MRSAIRRISSAGREGKGCVVLFAAGNDTTWVSQRQLASSIDEVIIVGATNSNRDHSSYSNWGPEVDVVGPSSSGNEFPSGRRIVTSDLYGTFQGYAPGSRYTVPPDAPSFYGFGGTSSSTPAVAGVCALMLTANPDLTSREVKYLLERTAIKIPGKMRPANYNRGGHSIFYGHGLVDAEAAVAAALGR